MRNLSLVYASLIVVSLLTGCLDSDTATEVPSQLNTNSDFAVVTDPPANAPPAQAPPQAPPGDINILPQPDLSLDGLRINQGRNLTDSGLLQLEFYPPFRPGYYRISEGSVCMDTPWLNYVDGRSYETAIANKNFSLSVQFRDFDGPLSPCYTRSIYIDRAGPEIIFAKYPSAPVEEGSKIEIVFSVTDEGSGVHDVACSVSSLSKPCGAGQNTITFPQMAAGDYTLTVTAKDNFGFVSEKSITFKVSSLYKQMAQNIKVSDAKKVDILFVIDNSGSMAYEQQSMASRVRNFLDVIKGLDWQIAVTTTDPRDITLGDGRLIQLYSNRGKYIITSAWADADAREALGMTLQRYEIGSSSEQGVYASYRAIERSIAATSTNVNFIRPDSQLAVIVISDEDESASGVKNDPANLISFVQNSFQGQKSLTFHSVITRPGDKACLNGQGYTAGFRYEQASRLTGGVIGDVCATDYAAQAQGIAEGVRKTLKSFTLVCQPIIDSTHAVKIMKDGVPYTAAHMQNGLNVEFTDILPAGNYEVTYSCVR